MRSKRGGGKGEQTISPRKRERERKRIKEETLRRKTERNKDCVIEKNEFRGKKEVKRKRLTSGIER